MLVVIVGLNFMPVRFYGETEFWFAGTKVILLVGLLMLSFILFWGGGPQQTGILGFHYWKDPGAANTYLVGGDTGRFVAFWKTMVLSVFPFTFAPELLVVTGGEMESPRRNLPKASKRYFYRLIFFYCFSVLAIGCICPSNAKALTDGGQGKTSNFIHALFSFIICAITEMNPHTRSWLIPIRRRHPKCGHHSPSQHRERRYHHVRLELR